MPRHVTLFLHVFVYSYLRGCDEQLRNIGLFQLTFGAFGIHTRKTEFPYSSVWVPLINRWRYPGISEFRDQARVISACFGERGQCYSDLGLYSDYVTQCFCATYCGKYYAVYNFAWLMIHVFIRSLFLQRFLFCIAAM